MRRIRSEKTNLTSKQFDCGYCEGKSFGVPWLVRSFRLGKFVFEAEQGECGGENVGSNERVGGVVMQWSTAPQKVAKNQAASDDQDGGNEAKNECGLPQFPGGYDAHHDKTMEDE